MRNTASSSPHGDGKRRHAAHMSAIAQFPPSPAALLRLGRVSNLPTVWTDVIAATAMAGGDPFALETGVVLSAMTLFYLGGMALNDAFDREIDARERPSRPIPAGEASAGFVFAAGFALLGGGGGQMATGGPAAFLAGIALAGLIVLYDLRHKGNPWSPLLMGGCRALVYAGASAAAVGTLTGPALVGAAAIFAHVVGLTYAAKQESLDRIERLWPLGVLGVPLVLAIPFLATPAAVVAWLALAAADLAAIRLLLPSRRPGAVGEAVGALIAAICLLDALLVAPISATAALLCAGAYLLTRLLHRVVPGT